MKITTLIENTLGENNTLVKEHGLCILIETSKKTILFDTGQSGQFITNAKALNIDLNNIDCIVLSHAHYDHANGLKSLLDNIHSKPDLYVSKYFFQNRCKYYYNVDTSLYRYIGINFDENFILSKNININYISKDTFSLTDQICIHTNFNRIHDFESLNKNMKLKINNKFIVDNFEDEVALSITTPKGLIIILGCSHVGVVNIIDTIQKRTNQKIYGVIGGTHLIEADIYRIAKTIEYFNGLNIKLIGVSHCTGKKAMESFKEKCNNIFLNNTGKTILL